MSARFPFPIPNGWFAVAWSRELAAGDVKKLFCFGRELVLFRAQSGSAHVLDAYCPHLGAHLAHGGKVEGEALLCPFHAWEWSGDGRCTRIPYAKRIPPNARIGSLPVCEKNGVVFAWHDAQGREPQWQVPDVAEIADPAWTDIEPFEVDLPTCLQELAENAHDPAHFVAVHGVASPPASTISFEGRVKVSENRGELKTPRGVVPTLIRGESHGLGLGITRVSGLTDMCFLAMSTPVDAENLKLRWAFTVPRRGDSTKPEGVARAFIDEFKRQLAQDIPIWANKRYEPRPILCDGDGPIAQFRRWAQQFYA